MVHLPYQIILAGGRNPRFWFTRILELNSDFHTPVQTVKPKLPNRSIPFTPSLLACWNSVRASGLFAGNLRLDTSLFVLSPLAAKLAACARPPNPHHDFLNLRALDETCCALPCQSIPGQFQKFSTATGWLNSARQPVPSHSNQFTT